ncbi:putative 50S ribosomal subunit protein L35 [Candidatus Hodgkinia cicadicola Dsem]|nr:putative 50S ribosomal subunit protein L35 [Candidatus Hodgkinia cicadicola Dsem]
MLAKLKTRSGAKKRFRRLAGGGVKAWCACRRHKLYNRRKTARQQRRSFVISLADVRKIKRVIKP